ncbi:hypothetical protein OM076_34780 [Solirubrobacter ginsenosidimutans]|uniref:Uncharacterized protein n=1 Tax=Solirubrobacter ginsenosidimutans TaxID=490573 RepID=A0A9X3N2I8_9ACTN|nr:hypothetical protein [Solirubrobacter ginsenosidimutans]MDA0165487.1 hypothetical protein [Solirubrobacter ginsenosidimutans]
MAKGTWWEYAVMRIRLVDAGAERWTFEANAWVDDREIYAETLQEHSWSRGGATRAGLPPSVARLGSVAPGRRAGIRDASVEFLALCSRKSTLAHHS